ncbi:PadR family transcriptional regulator [Oricola sp.]|uniref:PadR family transcriptional regulator n=1 Tax=Oricola sp. TaxID=1979950 RepID=UPI003516C3BF
MTGHMKGRFEGGHCGGRHNSRFAHEIFAMRDGRSGRGFGPGGHRGGRGFGDDDGGRMGRFLFRGDLRLVILALVENEPRHGYELIKQIEDMTGGFYAPSPGVVYPTLTYLEEAGYVRAEEDANKKRYSITGEGKAHLDENRAIIGKIFDKLDSIGERVRRRREHREGRDRGPDLPRSVDTALLHLRETIARKLAKDETKSGEIVRFLLGIADDLEVDDPKTE